LDSGLDADKFSQIFIIQRGLIWRAIGGVPPVPGTSQNPREEPQEWPHNFKEHKGWVICPILDRESPSDAIFDFDQDCRDWPEKQPEREHHAVFNPLDWILPHSEDCRDWGQDHEHGPGDQVEKQQEGTEIIRCFKWGKKEELGPGKYCKKKGD
jgi:hypothetical protein